MVSYRNVYDKGGPYEKVRDRTSIHEEYQNFRPKKGQGVKSIPFDSKSLEFLVVRSVGSVLSSSPERQRSHAGEVQVKVRTAGPVEGRDCS